MSTWLEAGELRRLFTLVLVAITGSLLVADYSRIPTDPVAVGDVATRTIKAPFSFSYIDEEADQLARTQAGAAALPVFLYEEGLIAETSERVSSSFRRARQAIEAQAAVGEEASDDPTATEVPPEIGQAVLAAFVRDLGVPVDPNELGPLVSGGFSIAAEERLIHWLVDAYSDHLVLADRSRLPSDERPLQIVPQVGDRDTFVLSDYRRVRVTRDVRQRLTITALRERGRAPWTSAIGALADALVRPNLYFDADRTTAAEAAAESGVRSQPVNVQRGETLFREGDKVSAQDVAKYQALQDSRSEHSLLHEASSLFAFLLLVLGVLYGSTRRFFRDDVDHTRDVAAVSLLVVLVAFMTRGMVAASGGLAELIGNEAMPSSVWYIAPVAAGAMLARVLMNRQRAAFYALAASTLCGLMMQLDALYVLYFLLTSAVAVAAVEPMRERIEVLRAGVMTGIFGAVFVLSIHFVQLFFGEGELSLAVTIRPFWSMVFAFTGGVLSAFLVLALIPIFETLGFVTDYRMLELASLNHPLMRQLMLRAPGTYHHSVVVGTLAEAACDAIGANSLQAKIAAYFHDIGKALKPQYFVENQRGGANRHNDISPRDSARIILGHVTEGARMAREHNLPQPIVDNIQMHHGTGLLQYFFAKAQMEAEDPASVDENEFRYPGPKPNTREAGIVMLADKVEAATRTIKVPTEDNIRAMINQIINSVMSDNQFSDCPLTFREIYIIADTFVAVLLGIYHQRIEYPQTSAISSGPTRSELNRAPDDPSGTAGMASVGTITLELETSPVAQVAAGGELWDDLGDEDTDYESVRNLPLGEP